MLTPQRSLFHHDLGQSDWIDLVYKLKKFSCLPPSPFLDNQYFFTLNAQLLLAGKSIGNCNAPAPS